jgi:hypothetical protein
MTTRRNLLIMAGGAALLGGCRESAGAPAAAAVPDVLLAESGAGLMVLGGARPGALGAQATARLDGALIYAVRGADLVRVDPAVGVPEEKVGLEKGWVPRAISGDGRSCVLSRTPAAVLPAARERTALLVTTGQQQERFDLGGVIEPDAFTSDGSGLFVLEWLPATAPDHYRVRLLDLGTGVVRPLLTRDKVPVPAGAEEEMRGDGRQAVLSPERLVLYTLYTHQPGHRHTRDLLSGRPGGAHAFVHVLHLAQGWAYCLDLPHPFGEGPAERHALALSADGRTLAVADVTSGSLAYADTESLTIRQVIAVPRGDGAASLVFTPEGDRVLVGAGTRVAGIGGGGPASTWAVPAPIRGLGLSRDGTRLYAGGTDEIVWLDTTSGELRGRSPAAGLTALRHVR